MKNPEATAFIKKCLHKNPAHRPNALELLEDPFIRHGHEEQNDKTRFREEIQQA